MSHHLPHRRRPHPGRTRLHRDHRRARRRARARRGPGRDRRRRGQPRRPRRSPAGCFHAHGADQPARPHRPGLGLRRHRRRRRPRRGPRRRHPGRRPGRRLRPRLRHVRRAARRARRADLAVVPDGLDLVTASTVPLNGLAAAQIVDLLGDAPADGNRLLVTGAAGAVGGYVASLAQDRGWQVTGLARAEDEEFVRGLGADFTTHAEPRLGRGRRRCRAAGAGPRPGPRRRRLRRRAAERRAGRGARRSPSSSWSAHPDGASTGRAARPRRVAASCRPGCTPSCRWTRSPTPTAPWPRAACAVATCSSPNRLIHS